MLDVVLADTTENWNSRRHRLSVVVDELKQLPTFRGPFDIVVARSCFTSTTKRGLRWLLVRPPAAEIMLVDGTGGGRHEPLTTRELLRVDALRKTRMRERPSSTRASPFEPYFFSWVDHLHDVCSVPRTADLPSFMSLGLSLIHI